VKLPGSTFAPPRARFAAATPPIAQAVGLGAAADYLHELGMADVAAHERTITEYALKSLGQVDGLRILGTTEIGPEGRGGAVSFTLATVDGLDIHPHDVMTFLDSRGVAVRGGHHCARPLHERLGITASTRASFYLYTVEREIDQLVDALDYTRNFFGRVA
jgi:cysteine desulfurase/selenocysteine lyase